MTLTASYKDVTQMALLMLALLAGMMAVALFLAQPTGLSHAALSNEVETSAMFYVQADGYTWLPDLSISAAAPVAFQVQADGYTYLPTL